MLLLQYHLEVKQSIEDMRLPMAPRIGHRAIMQNAGAQFEISVGGVPHTYRDRLDYATEAAGRLKQRNPHVEVVVRDLKTGERTIMPLPGNAMPRSVPRRH
jgi:hypothetical protein